METFCDYMNSLPNERTDTVHRLVKACRVTPVTVYRWMQGVAVPDALKRKMIAETLGKPENELFPSTEIVDE